MTFHSLFQDNIEKSGRYEFYCGPDDADYVSPVAFCVQVRIGKVFDKLGQTCLKQQHVLPSVTNFWSISEKERGGS